MPDHTIPDVSASLMSAAAQEPAVNAALAAARMYRALGWSVVPVRPREKLPAVAWAKLQKQRATDTEIDYWFTSGGYGVGLIQGANAGTITLDFDGEVGHATRSRLEAEHGPLPATPEAITPGGGSHIILRHPGKPVPTRKGVLPGMDVRGDGGFIVAFPSVHHTGRQYSWDCDAHPEDTAVADAPQWVVDLVCGDVEPGRGVDAAISLAPRQGALGVPVDVVTDGREVYMRDTVLAVLRDIRDRTGALPTAEELFAEVWPQYSARVDLTRPGRGADEVLAKCHYTLKRVAGGVLTVAAGVVVNGVADILPASEEIIDPETGEVIAFPATPLDTLDLNHIPPREWLYGRELLKGYVSVLGSPGGVGKTAFTLAAGVSVAANTPLLKTPLGPLSPFKAVHQSGAVWFYNLEDPADEMRRRFKALLIHQKLNLHAIPHKIYVDSGRDRALIITKRNERGDLVAHPLVDDLVAELQRRQIVLLVVDPFVQSHTAEENRNEEMNLVMSLWGKVAHRSRCAVWLIHHFRKGGQGGDSDSFRGAGAIQGAARVMSTLSAMSVEEASKLGIETDQRRQYIRLDNAKANMAPSADRAEWYKLVGVAINNGTPDYPEGDSVQSIEPWEPPSPWEGLGWSTIATILRRIEAGPSDGEFYAANKAAKDRWVGNILKNEAGKTDGQAASIIKSWVSEGVLVEGEYKSPAQKGGRTGCVTVNSAKAAEMMRGVSGGLSDAE